MMINSTNPLYMTMPACKVSSYLVASKQVSKNNKRFADCFVCSFSSVTASTELEMMVPHPSAVGPFHNAVKAQIRSNASLDLR